MRCRRGCRRKLKDDPSKLDHRRIRQRPARPDVCHRGPQDGLSRPHILAGQRHADRAGCGYRNHRRSTRIWMRSESLPRSVDVVTFEFENVPAATVDAAAEFVAGPSSGRDTAHDAKPPARKNVSFSNGFPVTPFRHIKTDRRSVSRPRRNSAIRRAENGRVRL